MKKLILIMLAVLTASALAYKLPTAWTAGGGLVIDSVRVTVYRATTSSGTNTAVSNVSYVGPFTDQSGITSIDVDSLCSYNIRYMYFINPDVFREFAYNVTPIDYEKYLRASLADLDTATQAVRDSMYEASQTGTLTLDQEDIDSISAAVVRGVNTAAGTGVNAVTLYARDTINGAFVSGVYITAVGGVDNLNATTGVNGFATFNCNTATYTFSALGSPYTWVPFTRAVAGNITDTITGGGVTVTPPADPTLCRVYGWEITNGWDTLRGVNVSLEIVNYSDTMQAGGVVVGAKVVTARTNSNGYWQMDVVPNSILDPNSRYIYRVSGGGLIRAKTFEVEVPDSGTVNIAILPKRKVQ